MRPMMFAHTTVELPQQGASSRDAAISVECVPAPAATTAPWSRQSAQLDRAAASLGWSRALNACKPGAHVSRGRGPTSLAPLFRQVADRLDVVAVRIVRVGAVVMLVVLRPEPRLAVVLSARGQRRRMERVDGGAVWARERDVRRP